MNTPAIRQCLHNARAILLTALILEAIPGGMFFAAVNCIAERLDNALPVPGALITVELICLYVLIAIATGALLGLAQVLYQLNRLVSEAPESEQDSLYI
jgi:predicted PurR-regulated permease PerM